MPSVLLVSGSPSATSRSGAVLDHVRDGLVARGVATRTVSIRDFPAEDLVLARYDSPAFAEFVAHVAAAEGLVIATPVYKAAYTGGLKALLDILPQTALRDKVILPLASGGSPGHLLAIDYALKPVLSALGATHLHQGVYLVDQQLTPGADGRIALAPELQERLESAVDSFAASLSAPV